MKRKQIKITVFLLLGICSNIYGYEFRDNFEDEICGTQPSHWIQKYKSDKSHWTVRCEDGNRVYQQSHLSDEIQYSYLHVFERNPDFEGRFRVEKTKEGYMAFLIRYNSEGTYVKLRYNFKNNLYEIVEKEETSPREVVRATQAGKLGEGWHRFKIEARDAYVKLVMDGQAVVETRQLLHQTFGRIGFETYHTTASFDDIIYQGQYGRVNNGVLEYELDIFSSNDKNIAQHLAIETLKDGMLIGMAATHDERVVSENANFPLFLIVSHDNGYSWENLSVEDRNYVTAGGDTVRHCCPQLLPLKSGSLLSCGLTAEGNFEFISSDDNGETWQKTGGSIPNVNRHSLMPDRLTQTSSGNIYGIFYDFRAKQYILYVSKDDGRNWSSIIPPKFNKENTWPDLQELQVVELPDSTLDIYARDGRAGANTLVVGRSIPDVSWNDLKDEMNNTPFISPKCAFNIERDQYNPQHYYMFWTYNDRHDEPAYNNIPRTRVALAVSYDGTKTWNYVMDVDEWGYPSTGFIDRDHRYANHTIHVGKEYIFLTVKRRNPIGEERHADGHVWFTRIEKAKIQPYPYFPGTHY